MQWNREVFLRAFATGRLSYEPNAVEDWTAEEHQSPTAMSWAGLK